jgi:kumamolisin
MGDRKVFADSVTTLPEQTGLTPQGLMINAARPQDHDQPMTILFSLDMPEDKHTDLEDKVARGETVSPQELKETYTPDPANVDALVKWLNGEGFQQIKVSPNGTGVYATAKASQIEKSLQVDMVRVTRDGVTYTAAKNAPSLPVEVAQSVHAIIGLQPFRHANKHRALRGNRNRHRPPMPAAGAGAATAPATGPTAATGAIAANAAPAPNIANAPPYLVSEILKAYNADGLGVTGTDDRHPYRYLPR